MFLVLRSTLLLVLTLTIAGASLAQEATATTAAATKSAPETTAAPEPTAYQVRNELTRILRDRYPELATILAIDHSLLNETYLAGYPEVARFVARHPEIVRNPRFYLAKLDRSVDEGVLSNAFEAMVIFSTFLLIFFALAWFVRTITEHKRWSRLARTQNEVHNKILDRFGSSEEVLAYIKTPAGAKFLESAPIVVSTGQPRQSSPATRVMWSIQIGVVVAAAALGMLVVSLRYDGPTRNDLFAMGVIAFCVGGGFIGSAVVSLLLSRRLGIWEGPDVPPADVVEGSGGVR
jgi:hypothetical protein